MSSEIIRKFNIIKSNKLAEIRNYNLIKYEVNKIKSEKVKAEKLALSIEIKNLQVLRPRTGSLCHQEEARWRVQGKRLQISRLPPQAMGRVRLQ